MSFEIGDEVVGILAIDPHTFDKTCRITDVRGDLVDVIVYDPDTRMWEDYDLTMVNLRSEVFRLSSPISKPAVIYECIVDVLNLKDPGSAVEVLISRDRLQDRFYMDEAAVADCTFISREELIRQSVECLVRLASASMAPYNEEVEMSKKKVATAPDDGPNNTNEERSRQDTPAVGDAPGDTLRDGTKIPTRGKAVDITQHELLPENFRNRPADWCRGFVERRLAGNVLKGKAQDEAIERTAKESPDYLDGWNKATNYLRSGGK